MYEEDYKGYSIEILPDLDAQNPRIEWDNLGTMACWYRDYDLGDKNHGDIDLNEVEEWDDGKHDSLSEALSLYLRKEKDARIVLPLVVLDHSGLWMRVGHSFVEDFGGWDTSFVGFMFVTAEQLRKEYSIQRISKKALGMAERLLRSEVETYNSYLSGAVYGWVAKDSDGEALDSCWGYYGYDEDDYMLDEARNVIDFHLDGKRKAK